MYVCNLITLHGLYMSPVICQFNIGGPNQKCQSIKFTEFKCYTVLLNAATVVCPSLDDPSNGSVSVSYNFVGGRAYYSCSSGYRRSHYSSRRCQLSGTWSGTQPTCISKYYNHAEVHGRNLKRYLTWGVSFTQVLILIF